jgi:hypothetical protein
VPIGEPLAPVTAPVPGESGRRARSARGRPFTLRDRRSPVRWHLPHVLSATTRSISLQDLRRNVLDRLGELGFAITMDTARGPGFRQRHASPTVEGLIVAERILRHDLHRSRSRLAVGALAFVTSFALAISGFARGLLSGIVGGAIVLAFCGSFFVGAMLLTSTEVFSSELVFVQISARRSHGSGPQEVGADARSIYELRVGAGTVLSVNRFNPEGGSRSRRVIGTTRGSESMASVPTRLVATVVAVPPLPGEPPGR